MRDRVLEAVRRAVAQRAGVGHPGSAPIRVGDGDEGDTAARFRARFEAAGGEVVLLPDEDRAVAWAASLAGTLASAAQSPLLPEPFRLPLPAAAAADAAAGVSLALAAVAETGSLVLTSREGRLLQLLPWTHLVWVPADRLVARLEDALAAVEPRDGESLAIHSGPSKSADIGRIVVTGVHGPARVIAALVGVPPTGA